MYLPPKKLLPRREKPSGLLLLDSCEYASLGVDDNERACSHSFAEASMHQISAALTRNEGLKETSGIEASGGRNSELA